MIEDDTPPDEANAGMSSSACRAALEELGLSPAEAAVFLGVSERTFRRYLDGDISEETGGQAVPGPVAQALRAWRRLNSKGLHWRPGERAIRLGSEAIARYQVHTLELDALLRRVEERGGPTMPWEVDLEAGKARLGAMSLSFYRLDGGGFAPQSYTRRDLEPDIKRDWPMLEEGFACVARELGRAGELVLPAATLGTAGLYGGKVILWEDRPFPSFVLLIPERLARKAAGLGMGAPASEILEFVNGKRRALAKVAVRLVANEEGEINSLGARELLADEAVLSDAFPRLHKGAPGARDA